MPFYLYRADIGPTKTGFIEFHFLSLAKFYDVKQILLIYENKTKN